MTTINEGPAETFEERIAALDEFEGLQEEAAEVLAAILVHRKFEDHGDAKAYVAALEALELEVTCGDCETGRCHWGGEQSRAEVALVEADPAHDRACGCRKHAASYASRQRRGQLREAGIVLFSREPSKA